MSYAPCSLPIRSRPMVMSLRQKRVISLAQFVLVIANTITLLPGLTFMGAGLVFLVLQKSVLPLVPFTLNLFAAPLVAMGCLAYGAAVLGYCSVWRHRRSLILMYSTCMIGLMATQVYLAAATASWGQLGRVRNLADGWLRDRFANNDSRKAFGMLEFVGHCCGSYGAESYAEQNLRVPEWCCAEGTTSDGSCAGGVTIPGCAGIVSEHVQTAAKVAGATFFYLLAIQLLALVASAFLFRNAPVRVSEPVYYIVRNPTRARDDHEQPEELVTLQPQRQTSL